MRLKVQLFAKDGGAIPEGLTSEKVVKAMKIKAKITLQSEANNKPGDECWTFYYEGELDLGKVLGDHRINNTELVLMPAYLCLSMKESSWPIPEDLVVQDVIDMIDITYSFDITPLYCDRGSYKWIFECTSQDSSLVSQSHEIVVDGHVLVKRNSILNTPPLEQSVFLSTATAGFPVQQSTSVLPLPMPPATSLVNISAPGTPLPATEHSKIALPQSPPIISIDSFSPPQVPGNPEAYVQYGSSEIHSSTTPSEREQYKIEINALDEDFDVVPDLPEVPSLARSVSHKDRTFAKDTYEFISTNSPQCAEKTLAKLYNYYLHEKSQTNSSDSALMSPTEIALSMELLHQQLVREQLMNSSIDKGLDDIKKTQVLIYRLKSELENMPMNAPPENFKSIREAIAEKSASICHELFNHLKEIRPVDLVNALRLSEKVAASASKIFGKDIILLLGSTGSGKSTTVHFLCGSEMKASEVRGLEHIHPINVQNSELEEVVTSPFGRSETRLLNAVKLFVNGQELFLCDSPGFFDTDGPEIDLANGIGMAKAIRGCRSIRPVLLISSEDLNTRSILFLKLIQTVCVLFSKLGEALSSFTFIFTKFEKQKEKYISARLTEVVRSMPGHLQADQTLCLVLKYICLKVGKKTIVLNPLEDVPNTILGQIVSTSCINKPHETIRDFVSIDSKDQLKIQLNRHIDCIRNALERYDTELVNSKLNELIKLNDLLDLSCCKDVHEECLAIVLKKVLHVMDVFSASINRLKVSTAPVHMQDISNIKEYGTKLTKFERIRLYHFLNHPIYGETGEHPWVNFIEHVEFFIQNAVRKLAETLVDLENQSLKVQWNSDAAVVHTACTIGMYVLEKIGMMKDIDIESAPSINERSNAIYKAVCNCILNTVQNCSVQLLQDVHDFKFSFLVMGLDFIKNIVNHWAELLSEEDAAMLASFKVTTCSEIMGSLYTCAAEARDMIVIPSASLSRETLDHVFAVMEKLRDLSNIQGLKNHLDSDRILDFHGMILDQAQKSVQFCLKLISQCLPVGNDIANMDCELIGSNLRVIQMLYTSPEVKMRTVDAGIKVSNDVASKLNMSTHCISNAARFVIKSLNNYGSRVDAPKPADVAVAIRNVIAAEKHLNGCQDIYLNQHADSVAAINESLDELMKVLKTVSLEPACDPAKVRAVFSTMAWLSTLPCISIFDCSAHKLEFYGIVKRSLLTLQNYTQHCSLTSIDYRQMRQNMIFLFLCRCYDFDELRPSVSAAVESLNECIKIIDKSLRETIIQCFDSLRSSDSSTFSTNIDTALECFEKLTQMKEFYVENPIIAFDKTDGMIQFETAEFEVLFVGVPESIRGYFCQEASSPLMCLLDQLNSALSIFDDDSNLDSLHSCFIRANALIPLDKLLSEGLTFKEISLQIESKVNNYRDSKKNMIVIAILKQDYQQVSLQLKAFDNSAAEQIQGVVAELRTNLRTLVDTIETSVSSYKCQNTESLGTIMNNINSVYVAQAHVWSYLTVEDQGYLTSRLTASVTALQKCAMDYISTCDTFIKNLEFRDAELRLKHLYSLCDKFGSLEAIPGPGSFKIRLNESILKVGEDIRAKVISEISRYSKIDSLSLAKFKDFPPVTLFERLRAAKDFDNYKDWDGQLQNSIKSEIIKLMSNSKKESTEAHKKQLEDIEQILVYIPQDVVASFNDVIISNKKELEDMFDLLRRNLEEEAAVGQLDKLLKMLNQFCELNEYRKIRMVMDSIRQLIRKAALRVDEDIKKSNMISALKQLPNLLSEWHTYLSLLNVENRKNRGFYYNSFYKSENIFSDPSTRALYNQMCDVLVTALRKTVDDLLAVPEDRGDSLKLVAVELEKVHVFFESWSNTGNQWRVLIEQAFPDINKLLKIAFKRSSQVILGHQNLFNKHLADRNFSSLNEVLDSSKGLSTTFYTICNCCRENQFCAKFGSDLKSNFEKLLSYEAMSESLNNGLLTFRDYVKQSFVNNPKTKSVNSIDRDEFYGVVSSGFESIGKCKAVSGHIGAVFGDAYGLEQQCRRFFSEEIAAIEAKLLELVDSVLTIDIALYSNINIWYDNFRSISQNFEDASIVQEAKNKRDNVDMKIRDKLRSAKAEAWERRRDDDAIISFLIVMKTISQYIAAYCDHINSVIADFFVEFAADYRDEYGRRIAMLGLTLNTIKGPNEAIAQRIIREVDALKSYALQLHNEVTGRFTFEDVMKTIQADGPLNKAGLQTHHEAFQNEYWNLVDNGRVIGRLRSTLSNIPECARSLVSNNSISIRNKARHLMAYIFAYWTLDNLRSSNKENMKKNELRHPHAAQIIAIFRLLDVENEDLDVATTDISQISLGPMLSVENETVTDDIISEEKTVESSKGTEKVLMDAAIPAPSPGACAKCSCAEFKSLNRTKMNKFCSNCPHSIGDHNLPPSMGSSSTGSAKPIMLKSISDSASKISSIVQKLSSPVEFQTEGGSSVSSDKNLAGYLSSLKFHLVQILTGEGKSIALAVVSIVLALLGCNVDCACYSEYLSKRDFNDFKTIFDAFGVRSSISYGTFHQLCEKFINRRGDIRQLVEKVVLGGSVQGGPLGAVEHEQPKIIIIDEVDVFFSQDFYGSEYRPFTKLATPEISELIKYIWSVRDDKVARRFNAVSKSPNFAKCRSRFGDWADLFEECIKEMLDDLITFESIEYTVKDNSIGYQDQDGISYKKDYGNKTLFAYFKECAADNIPPSVLESKLALTIDSGSFSYAEIPLMYCCILGVTGTLKTLSPPEMNVLTSVYNISQFTYMPSVYGDNQLEFAGDVPAGCKIETSISYYSAIRSEIQSRLNSLDSSSNKRAVLVFFESTPRLLAFYKSKELADIRERVSIVTEETSSEDKAKIFSQAVTQGSVTLLHKVFGRGTDFYCYDNRLNNSGGVHVMQTFVSDVVSEEVQIKGRTARQGNKGSYSMVLLDAELEKYGIRRPDIERMKATSSLYSTINTKRCEYFDALYPESMRFVSGIREGHVESVSFVSDLLNRRNERVKEFLMARNKAMVVKGESKPSRTVVLMDATGSMLGFILKSKNTVYEMFKRINTILEEQGSDQVVSIQFVAFRNYDCRSDDIIMLSGWETKANGLHTFLSSVEAKGGTHWEEAVELALFHATTEEEVTQVILIGDAAPNQESQVQAGRAKHGEHYWQETRFSVPTHYVPECNKLKAMGIPVHAFYVHPSAAKSFKHISELTEGACAYLNVNDPQTGAAQLTDLMSTSLLQDAGGEEYVSAYKAKYGFTA